MIAPEPATIPANHAMRGWVNGVLPTPLLLDATWWFDDPTIDFFQEEIEKREEQVVVCLGTPTLLVAGKLPRSNRRLILIDKDRVLTEALQKRGYSDVFVADLMRESPPCFSAGMVIVDPPGMRLRRNRSWQQARACLVKVPRYSLVCPHWAFAPA